MRITVDGRIIETDSTGMLLELLEKQGTQLPRLCNHPSLTPNGACRLCVVEITKHEWGGSSKLVTSCLYPLEDGLIVLTRSEDVLKTRRGLLELYLSRYPGSELIRNLADGEGIDPSQFTAGDEQKLCVLCGLCTRVCQDCGPGAISTLGRGVEKQIGPGLSEIAKDCTGCRACAYICPTGAISSKQQNQAYTIWNRSFELPVCEVRAELCRGCGTCEEVCPESIPRVTVQKNGAAISRILAEACTGCGICAGACPTGAIKQKKTGGCADFHKILHASNLQGKKIAFICPRSPMPDDPEDIVLPVSCIGSVDISTLLYCIAAGADAVTLLCRDYLSCPYRRGYSEGEKRVSVAGELLRLCGLEKERIALTLSGPGPGGPDQAWREFKRSARRRPAVLKSAYIPETSLDAGMDLTLDIVRWLKERPELNPALPAKISSLFETTEESTTILYLDRLPELSLLLTLVMDNDEPAGFDLLKSAAQLLKSLGIAVRCAATQKELRQGNAERVIAFTLPAPSSIPARVLFSSINELAGVKEGYEKDQFTFRIDTRRRKKLLENYQQARGRYLCLTPEHCLQYALLLRRGAWQQSLQPQPVMRFAYKDDLSPAIDHRRQAAEYRVERHPVLTPPPRPEIKFLFNDLPLPAGEGEVISSALYAAGIKVFGHHHRDGGAQGIFCANGQCSQCMVIADGKPVKACMTPVVPGMRVESVEVLPVLSGAGPLKAPILEPAEIEVEVLIIGGGPAGICAAIELSRVGVDLLLVDDKQDLGGKLSLQTHNFFGSVSDCYAGTRGVQIGRILADELNKLSGVKIWLNSTVIGVFSDGRFGISGNGTYRLVKPKRVLFATGAREKSLSFPGCDLPGVYGAGAFQTLVNRDLVRCAERLFIIGGGNVGLIGAYHALQAGIDVVGLVEALPRCGGYKVHEDKIKRLGVPVWTAHTVLRIEGEGQVERVVIAAVDNKFQPVPGSERSFAVDTVLIAVGLSPVDELLIKAREYGMEVYSAGDADEIAEASAAIFSGKIVGRKIARSLGIDLPVPFRWEAFGELLKHRPGEDLPFEPEEREAAVYPLIRCRQEIPCNPCVDACPKNCITISGSILSMPGFAGECVGCGRCVLACPGLAITVAINDYDPDKEKALLLLPYEFNNELIPLSCEVTTTGMEGEIIGRGRVIAWKERATQDHRRLVLMEVPYADRLKVAGFRMRETRPGSPATAAAVAEDDPIVCRCERIRKSEIVREIRAGVRDINQLKAVVRAGLGACGGKTCTDLILRLYREEGVPLSEITKPTHRPLVAEVHLGDFVSVGSEGCR